MKVMSYLVINQNAKTVANLIYVKLNNILKRLLCNHQYTVLHNIIAKTSDHSQERQHDFDFENIKFKKKQISIKKHKMYKTIYTYQRRK